MIGQKIVKSCNFGFRIPATRATPERIGHRDIGDWPPAPYKYIEYQRTSSQFGGINYKVKS